MKILILCDVLFPQTTGGAGRVARELAIALRKLGDEVQFLTRRTPKILWGDDIKTTYFPSLGRALLGHYGKTFGETIDLFKPDIVHVHQPLVAFLSIPSHFSRFIVYNYHSSWPQEFKIKSSRLPRKVREMFAPLLSRIERQVLCRAARIVALSEYSRRQVEKLYKLRSVLIPGGVDSKRFHPVEKERSNGGLHLITLRNLVPRMGLAELIHSIKLLPSHAQLDIGGQGPLRPELERLIDSLGLTHRVRLLGHIPDPDLPCFYCNADWFVLPTVALEGFGLVILESLSCGTPVVGTRIGAIPELLERFDAQWVIPEPTPEAIAATILSVNKRQAPPPWELHELVAAEFDWETIAKRYQELFQSCL